MSVMSLIVSRCFCSDQIARYRLFSGYKITRNVRPPAVTASRWCGSAIDQPGWQLQQPTPSSDPHHLISSSACLQWQPPPSDRLSLFICNLSTPRRRRPFLFNIFLLLHLISNETSIRLLFLRLGKTFWIYQSCYFTGSICISVV